MSIDLHDQLAEIIEASMDNTNDMDVTFGDFARAAAEAIVAAMPSTSEDSVVAQLNQLSLAGNCLDLKARAEAAEARIDELEAIYVLKRAECDGVSSMLLSVQQDCIAVESRFIEQRDSLVSVTKKLVKTEAKRAEEQRISTLRGNTIEFDLIPSLSDAQARIAELEALVAHLTPFAKMGDWATAGVFEAMDLDSHEVFDAAKDYGLLVPIEGGYDPEEHDDEHGGAEAGDDWYSQRHLNLPTPPETTP